jgi:hypothetical protein
MKLDRVKSIFKSFGKFLAPPSNSVPQPKQRLDYREVSHKGKLYRLSMHLNPRDNAGLIRYVIAEHPETLMNLNLPLPPEQSELLAMYIRGEV